VFTQRKFVADFLQVKCNFRRKTAVSRFERPFGGLEATYYVHLRLTGKRVVDFLLVFNLTFFRYVLRLRRYEQMSIENRRFRSNGVSLTENFR